MKSINLIQCIYSTIYFTSAISTQAENTREEAKQLISAAQTKTNSTQNEVMKTLYCTVLYCGVLCCTVLYCTVQVTERLGERLQNINLWKFELEKTIRDMVGLKLQTLHRFSQHNHKENTLHLRRHY